MGGGATGSRVCEGGTRGASTGRRNVLHTTGAGPEGRGRTGGGAWLLDFALSAQARCACRGSAERLTWRPPPGCARSSYFCVPRTCCFFLLLGPTRPTRRAKPPHLRGRRRRTSAITMMPTWRDFWSSGRSVLLLLTGMSPSRSLLSNLYPLGLVTL